jgi:tRNA dimethylallyltransferase
MLEKVKKLIVVVGATAVGKTEFCIKLAQKLQTVIISADSRQFYCEMSIGTAKPSQEELAIVPHYCINTQSIRNEYNAGEYEKDVLALLETLFQTYDKVILTGGSGLYIQAICNGMDNMPQVPPSLRTSLNQRIEQEGLEVLLAELAILDPEYYQKVDKANPQRIVRALEICLASGKPYSSFRVQQTAKRPFEILKIGLQRERAELYARIDARIDKMIAEGLLEEVKSLQAYRNHNALQTVGYKEIFDFLDQQYDWQECVRLLKRNSRHYAKRQLTWFGKDTQIQWLEVQNAEKWLEEQHIIPYI